MLLGRVVPLSRRGLLRTAGALALPAALRPAHAAGRRLVFVTPFNFTLAYAPVFLARASGAYERAGLDVEVVNGRGAQLALQLVVAGQAQIGHTGGHNYILSRADAAAPVQAIATYSQTSPFAVISAPGAPVRQPADLVGKTVGVASLGGSQHATLRLALRNAGVDANRVNFVAVADIPASFGLIAARRLDAFVGPFSTVVRLPQAVSMPLDDAVPSQVYLVNATTLEANAEAFVSFLRVTRAAAVAILDAPNLAPILAQIGARFEVPGIGETEVASADLRANAATWDALGRANLFRSVPERWAGAVRLMKENGLIRNAPDPATLYTNALLERALA